MHKILLIAEFEFLQTAKRWQFLAITMALPLFIAFISFLSYQSGTFASRDLKKKFESGQKILIQDQSGLFELEDDSKFKVVDSLDDHTTQIFAGESLGYIEITSNYLETAQLNLVVPKNKAMGASKSFQSPTKRLLRKQLLRSIPSEEQKERVYDTLRFHVKTVDQKGHVEDFDYHQMIIPGVFLLIFILAVSTASTFLLQSVSEEKENRTIEILLSTVRDNELIAGKVIGLGGAALLQVGIWIAMAFSSMNVLSNYLNLPLDINRVPTDHMVYGSVVLLLGFMIFAAVMVGVGALAPNYKDAQQYSSVFLIGSILPVYVMQIIINDIHGNLSLFLYYFPLTSPLVMVTRYCLGNLPNWEIALGLAVLVLFTILSIWFASKMFRIGCLMFNRRPSMQEIREAILH